MVNVLENILQERYNECNTQGHLKQDKEKNYCSYCYKYIKKKNLDDYQIGLKKLAEELAIMISFFR